MGDRPALKLVAQPQDFFRELVTEALGRQRVSAQPETEFYLVQLMNRFMTSDQLPDGTPLAFMLKKALETPQVREQSEQFRRIGDVSLYMAGYFQDSLSRKLVDVDYYIEMGGSAYQQVAARVQDGMRPVYRELADKFAELVEVLAEVSSKTTPRSEQDLLRLYEIWVTTRSERAARALQEAGISPNETIKKEWQ